MKRVTIQKMIENNVNIFDFEYPMFREEYKKTFEQNFLDYFLTDVIGLETVSLFKHRLMIKLRLMMPYYNKIFETQEMEQRILDNYDVKEVYNRSVISDSVNNTHLSTKNNVNSTNKNLYKDAPKTKIDIDKFDVVTNLSKDENTSTAEGTTVNSTDGFTTNTEKWERTMQGNIGVQTDSDAILKYWDSIRRVEQEIFDELECLFMGVYE
ncbi:MAG: hypothetical protein ACRCXT_18480 [Paraclostridium sp.]